MAAFAVIFALVLSGCAGSSGPPSTTETKPPPPVEQVRVYSAEQIYFDSVVPLQFSGPLERILVEAGFRGDHGFAVIHLDENRTDWYPTASNSDSWGGFQGNSMFVGYSSNPTSGSMPFSAWLEGAGGKQSFADDGTTTRPFQETTGAVALGSDRYLMTISHLGDDAVQRLFRRAGSGWEELPHPQQLTELGMAALASNGSQLFVCDDLLDRSMVIYTLDGRGTVLRKDQVAPPSVGLGVMECVAGYGPHGEPRFAWMKFDGTEPGPAFITMRVDGEWKTRPVIEGLIPESVGSDETADYMVGDHWSSQEQPSVLYRSLNGGPWTECEMEPDPSRMDSPQILVGTQGAFLAYVRSNPDARSSVVVRPLSTIACQAP